MTKVRNKLLPYIIIPFIHFIYGFTIELIGDLIVDFDLACSIIAAVFVVLEIITLMYAKRFSQLLAADYALMIGLSITACVQDSHGGILGRPDDLSAFLFSVLFYPLMLFLFQIVLLAVYALLCKAYRKFDPVVYIVDSNDNSVKRIDHSKRIKLVTSVVLAAYCIFVIVIGSTTEWLLPMGDITQAEFELSGSELYSDEEVQQAAEQVLREQFIHADAKKLLKLGFFKDGFDEKGSFEIYRKEHPEYTKAVVFYSEVVFVKDTGSTSKNTTYHWRYTVAGTDNGTWKVVSWGYS